MSPEAPPAGAAARYRANIEAHRARIEARAEARAERAAEREALALAEEAVPQLAIEDLGVGAAVSNDAPLVFHFPGFAPAGAECGEPIKWAHAARAPGEKGHWVRSEKSCVQASCAACYEKWAAHEAVEIGRRVGDGLPRVGRKNAIHVVASPPQKRAKAALLGKRSFVKLRRESQRILRRAGVVGGCLIFHHKRVPGKWNERSLCVDGPHFHCLGAGWIDGTAALNQKTGWVVRNLGVRKSVYATALYLLSHAGLGYPASAKTERPRMAVNTVVWFGEWSYQKFPSCPGPDEEGRWCPVCREYVPVREWVRLTPGPPDETAARCGEISGPEGERELRAAFEETADRAERMWS